jgi:hypothetical protein
VNSEYFRPAQFVYDGTTIRCPAGQTLRPSGIHTLNLSIRYRTSACTNCSEARIYANPSLMTIRRCTVEHPFGTIKRMSGGGRFLTRGLRAVKAEAALSILAFNILHAVNAFGAAAVTAS